MFKKYQAGSDLAFSVMVGNERMRIVFEGKTMGSSVYMTRDPKVQKAIESHYWFNDKFFLVESIDEKKEAAEPAETDGKKIHKRAEKVGIVSSDKMMKTVTVRVDRLVKHPVYRKYVRKRKKFMAHDEIGAKVGDKVKIVETRPLSARKRWRVVEIIQKAEL